MKVAIIDYGAGNLFSVKNALDYLGAQSFVSGDREAINCADKIILPGVGAFPDAMKMLREAELDSFIVEQSEEKPLLGICLGMQMLFDKSYEFHECDGLGLIHGEVKLMTPNNLAIPHMGWNMLEGNETCGLSSAIGADSYVYFVHSYAAECSSENVAFYSDYGQKIPALVFRDNVYGCQFHPEKSGDTGLAILEKFCNL